MPAKSRWTILTYIAAHNNLEQLGQKSLREILSVGSRAEVVQGALYDWKKGAARYLMGKPELVDSQQDLGRYDSGDPDELIATAKWLFDQKPAERYGLVLWSHGSGWEPDEIDAVSKEARPGAQADPDESRQRAAAPGSLAIFRSTIRALLKPDKPSERAILFDDGTGHSLDTLELARVVETIAEHIGQPLEFLGMDACLMANLEVAYEVRKAVRCLVASEELVPGHSWPYQQVFGALKANPDQNGKDFARLVVEQYVDFYTAHPPGGGDVTKIALDLSRIEELVHSTDQLADALSEEMSNNGNALWTVQQTARDRETSRGKRRQSKFDYHLWDIGSIAGGLAHSPSASASVQQSAAGVTQALKPGEGAVIAEGHRGDWFEGIAGVTAYLMPPGQQRISPSYSNLAFAKDTHWDEMLSAYHEHFD
jgi:hypothetical protein